MFAYLHNRKWITNDVLFSVPSGLILGPLSEKQL